MCAPKTCGLLIMALMPVAGVHVQQSRQLPVLDMHVHAQGADSQGPPPLAICPGSSFPAWDQRTPSPDTFIASLKKPACAEPVWSPTTDDGLREQTVAALHRRNVIALLGGTPARVQRWMQDAPGQVIPSLSFKLDPDAPTPAAVRELHASGRIRALAEVTNQYAGIAADDAAFEPYLAAAEAIDLPVGIHVGPGPPGAPYLGFTGYRARLHSALALEEPLLKHQKLRVFVMHAGWPMIDDMLAVMWAHRQVYVEVGVIVWALPRAEFYRYLHRLVDAGFGDRVMFGSDQMVWPGLIEHSIRVIEEAPLLSAAQKRDILYNNAARFLRLPQADIDRHHGR
ncbi:MAG TPA: amidohydrolase family protein [Vicinamibacterales bacterium]|nr:amidohydrolase family protein [Vicinamibacterales bacterium]